MLRSIGHSNHDFSHFTGLLKAAGVEVVADVRTRPYSWYVPAYNQEALRAGLASEGMGYVFMGEALGGKRAGGYAQRVASSEFREGIEALCKLGSQARVAMMCAERHPLDCHRCRLIGRFLLSEGEEVAHLLADGTRITQGELQAQLLEEVGVDLFSDEADRLERAYAWKR